VISKLGDKQSVIRDFVNHSVFFLDSSRPITGEAVFKRLSFDLFDELVDPVKNLLVGFLPVQSAFPGVLGEEELYSRSSSSDHHFAPVRQHCNARHIDEPFSALSR
tara:strand:- start:164 stop:481 length:318 start_codon:yes stop_codon:yes gene_type:complete